MSNSTANRMPPGFDSEEDTFFETYKYALSGICDYFVNAHPELSQQHFTDLLIPLVFRKENANPGVHLQELANANNNASLEEFQVLKMNVALGYIARALAAQSAGFMGLAWFYMADAQYYSGALTAGYQTAITRDAVARRSRTVVSRQANDTRHEFSRLVNAELLRLVRLQAPEKKWESPDGAIAGCVAQIRTFEDNWLNADKGRFEHTKKPSPIATSTMTKWVREMADRDEFIQSKKKKLTSNY